MITLNYYSDFSVDSAVLMLKKHRFPAARWIELASCLMMASTVSTIEADDKTVDEQLVALINQWVEKDPKASWRELVDALNMCSMEAVASAISKDAGL